VRTYISAFLLLALAAGTGSTASAQVSGWDNSGNGLLKGTYYFRHVMWVVDNTQSGSLTDALALYNTITFDGNTNANGTYTINGVLFDGASGSLQNETLSGTYSIAASGFGFIDNAFAALVFGAGGDEISGLVSNGVFIGSSTENLNGYNDLFIAAPVTSDTVASLNGNYAIMGIDSPTGDPFDSRDALITFTANGAGGLSSTTARGYIGANGSAATTQNIGNIKYSFSNGGCSIQFPGTSLFTLSQQAVDSTLIQGAHFMYLSPDGNFIFGGGQAAFDMYVGVRVGSGGSNFSGLYYQAGMDQDLSQLANGFANLDNYYGSFKAASGSVLGHQRLFSPFDGNPFDLTYTGTYQINSDGSSDDGFQHYLFDASGKYRVGVGLTPFIGISVGLAGPTFTNSGVFLDPTGITNTGSSALFTSSIAPGELLTVYGATGSTLAAGSARSSLFPITLDGVSVKVNTTAAPILSVNGCGPYPCVTFMVPYETPSPGLALIQITSNKVASNTIAAVVGLTAPGIFTVPAGGIGAVAATHADGTLVNSSHPALIGESVAIYLTGLGAVTPAVADGAPGPIPAANAVNTIDAFVSGVQALTPFVGLTPTAAGLGQVNVTIPAGVTPGDNNIMELAGPDSDTFQALISIGAAAGSDRTAEVAAPHAVPNARQSSLQAHRRAGRKNGSAADFRRTIEPK
jgi:uncharacterized protein (TIGR03437 family)